MRSSAFTGLAATVPCKNTAHQSSACVHPSQPACDQPVLHSPCLVRMLPSIQWLPTSKSRTHAVETCPAADGEHLHPLPRRFSTFIQLGGQPDEGAAAAGWRLQVRYTWLLARLLSQTGLSLGGVLKAQAAGFPLAGTSHTALPPPHPLSPPSAVTGGRRSPDTSCSSAATAQARDGSLTIGDS